VTVESSTSARFRERAHAKARLVTLPDNAAGVKALLAGEVDGVVADLQS